MINTNKKSGIIIGIVSAGTGAVIYLGSKIVGHVKNRKKVKAEDEIPVEETVETEEKDQNEESK